MIYLLSWNLLKVTIKMIAKMKSIAADLVAEDKQKADEQPIFDKKTLLIASNIIKKVERWREESRRV